MKPETCVEAPETVKVYYVLLSLGRPVNLDKTEAQGRYTGEGKRYTSMEQLLKQFSARSAEYGNGFQLYPSPSILRIEERTITKVEKVETILG